MQIKSSACCNPAFYLIAMNHSNIYMEVLIYNQYNDTHSPSTSISFLVTEHIE